MLNEEAMVDRKPGPIQHQVEGVAEAIQQLVGAISRLEDRLRPGLARDNSEEAALAEEKVSDIDNRSALAQYLNGYVDQIAGLRRRLDRLTERIEL